MDPSEITVPLYTSASSNPASVADLIELDTLFQEDFFPSEVEYANYLTNVDMGSQFSYRGGSPSLSSFGFSPSTTSAMSDAGHPDPTSEVLTIPPSVLTFQIPLPTKKKQHKDSSGLSTEVSHGPGSRRGTSRAEPDGSDESGSGDEDEDGEGPYSKRQAVDAMSTQSPFGEPPEGRRERNKEHAKRSRWRKKVLLDTLQGQLSVLREENNRLRRTIVERIPNMATVILSQCTTTESSLLDGYDSGTSDGASQQQRQTQMLESMRSNLSSALMDTSETTTAKSLMESDYRFIHSLVSSQQTFVLSDPLLPDNPIIYCSDGFCKLTGYKRNAVLGRNCRFLQGPGTDPNAVEVIRRGLQDGRDVSVCLLNYKADGTPFWNQFFVGALRDDSGQIVNHVGIQCEVNTIPVKEIKDRVKKLVLPGT